LQIADSRQEVHQKIQTHLLLLMCMYRKRQAEDKKDPIKENKYVQKELI